MLGSEVFNESPCELCCHFVRCRRGEACGAYEHFLQNGGRGWRLLPREPSVEMFEKLFWGDRQARAIRRCGELLKQIPNGQGIRTDLELPTGTVTRSQAAADAGLSERQKVTALRVANVPEAEFARLADTTLRIGT
jgi:hypothetical protein